MGLGQLQEHSYVEVEKQLLSLIVAVFFGISLIITHHHLIRIFYIKKHKKGNKCQRYFSLNPSKFSFGLINILIPSIINLRRISIITTKKFKRIS